MTTRTVSHLDRAKVAIDQECLYRNSNECTGVQKEEVSELDQYGKLEKGRGEEEAKQKDR